MKKFIIVLVVVLIAGGGLYFVNYGTKYPPCSKYDTYLDIPEPMKMYSIRFEGPVMYDKAVESFYPWEVCPNIFKDATSGGIITNNQAGFPETTNPVPVDGQVFKVLRRAYVKCATPMHLNCFEDVPGDTLLLENQQGERFYTYTVFLRKWNNKAYAAGYYDAVGNRVGNVEISTTH